MTRTPEIEQKLTAVHGNLHETIPALVNRLGQEQAARRLSRPKDGLVVKQAWVSRWLKDNGYKRRTVYKRPNQEKVS